MKQLGILTGDDIRSLELTVNKISCAGQALRPDAIPVYAPKNAKNKFFREAIFAYADSLYLQENFWRDLARQHGISAQNIGRLWIDFDTCGLFLK